MSYIGTEPKDIRSFGRTKFDYTATQGQTAFTGADDDGKVLAFTVGQIEVYVNGILMDDSDFTTTGTGTVTLVSAANLNDVISIVSFETNIPDSNYVPASGGTFTGNITASGTLDVTGAVTASNGLTVDDDGATPLTVDRATNDGAIIDVQKDGTTVGSIGTSGGDIYVGSTASLHAGITFAERAALPNINGVTANDGGTDLGATSNRWRDLYLSGGVYLGGTGAANHLDDYEEGTWTPAMQSGTLTNVAQATYTKIGNVCHCQCKVGSFSDTTSGNAFELIGLPFNFFTTDRSAISTSVLSTNVSGMNDLNGYLESGNKLRLYSSVTGGSYDALIHSDLVSGSVLYIGFSYFTA